MKNNFDIYLYDWDGCIAKTLHLWFEVYQKYLKKRSIFISNEEVVNKFFGNWNGPAEIGVPDAELYMNEVVKEVNENLHDINLYDNLEQTFTKLKNNNKKIVVVSSAKKNQIEKIIKVRKLEKYFDLLLAKDDVVKTKPDPEIIFKALQHFDFKFDAALIIGDSPHDILAGKNAKIKTAIYYPTENHIFYSKKTIIQTKADFLIKDHLEIFNL